MVSWGPNVQAKTERTIYKSSPFQIGQIPDPRELQGFRTRNQTTEPPPPDSLSRPRTSYNSVAGGGWSVGNGGTVPTRKPGALSKSGAYSITSGADRANDCEGGPAYLPPYLLVVKSPQPAGLLRKDANAQPRNDLERERKRTALMAVGAHVVVVRTCLASPVPSYWGPAEELSFDILAQLKMVCYNFKVGLPHKRIWKVEYVMNKALYEKFNETKQKFRAHGKSTKELLLFHGTKAKNINRYTSQPA